MSFRLIPAQKALWVLNIESFVALDYKMFENDQHLFQHMVVTFTRKTYSCTCSIVYAMVSWLVPSAAAADVMHCAVSPQMSAVGLVELLVIYVYGYQLRVHITKNLPWKHFINALQIN